MRTESFADSFTHLVIQRIFHRPAMGSVISNLVSPPTHILLLLGSPKHVHVTVQPWALSLHGQARGASPAVGRTIPGRHSCTRAAGSNSTTQRNDCRPTKWIPLNPNYMYPNLISLVGSPKCHGHSTIIWPEGECDIGDRGGHRGHSSRHSQWT